MNTVYIDEAIERYVNERMTAGKERAKARFLSYAHLRYTGEEIAEFMRHTTKLSRYYIHLTKVLENPFLGREMAYFASMLVVAIFSCWLLNDDNTMLAGVFVLSGTIVNGWSLLRLICEKWRETGVMIAIYEEIADLAEKEAISCG
ncbi:MAG TPA: hypothetical protein VGJ93_10775 [Desulfuromonadaceae bacterium]|jgi:hypothetical protein